VLASDGSGWGRMKRAQGFRGWLRGAAVATAAVCLAVACDAAPGPDDDDAAGEDPASHGRDVSPTVDGVALGIVYDTSGSMADTVANASGASEPKYRIAARAFGQILDRLTKFQDAATPSPRKLEVGVWIFKGSKVAELCPMAPFDAASIRRSVEGLHRPSADTPLGRGVEMAAAAVLATNLTHRHVLVVTDGINTTGPDPAKVWPGLDDRAKIRGSSIGAHFVAFDVDAKVFDPMKRLGATVLAATDERTLSGQLGFILDRKILLEDEEPARREPSHDDVKKDK
jgi:hypothetical protein